MARIFTQTPIDGMYVSCVTAHQSLRRDWTRSADRLIAHIVEPLAALLIVIELITLAAGVFFRYVLHDALVWGDELASNLFLWLIMLGAVAAYQRGSQIASDGVDSTSFGAPCRLV